ncbi:uncharacterized protein LOC119826021 [Arvicola amphibius]|nr:uncharacterized protein LOC119826021 [Arvicola amphibius]
MGPTLEDQGDPTDSVCGDLMISSLEAQLESLPGEHMGSSLQAQPESIHGDPTDSVLGDPMGTRSEDQGDPTDSVLGDAMGSMLMPEDQLDTVPGDPMGTTPEGKGDPTDSVLGDPTGSTRTPEDQLHTVPGDPTESVLGDLMCTTPEDQGDTTDSVLEDPTGSTPTPEDQLDTVPGDPTESVLGDQMGPTPEEQGDQLDLVPGDPKILDFGDLKKVIEDLITSLHNGDRDHLIAFLSTYPAHTTIEQVLDVIFRRYAHFRPGCQEDEGIKNAICTLLDTWTSIFPGDFSTRSGLCALSKMKAYLIIHCPYSDVLIRVHELLTSLLSETSEESD